jgi:glutamate-1-semialdehyde aminotransferase
MPADLVGHYQRHLRQRGVDLMSSTGGVLSAAHGNHDIEVATKIFEEVVLALLQSGHVFQLETTT